MKLPQCEIDCAEIENLIIAGGRRPEMNWFKAVAKGKKIFAVDRGVELCRDFNILPEKVIGDFDSAENSAVDWAAAKNIPIERHPIDKDFTDTQLALSKIKKPALITGIFGGRFDHSFSNIFSCANSSVKIILADEREIIFYVKSGENFTVKFFQKPMALSLLPISKICSGVTINNVHWKLENATLAQDLPNAISNRVENDGIKISVDSGTLAVYFCFSELIPLESNL